MRSLDKRLRELEEAAGVVRRRALNAAQLRRLVSSHWNVAFGEATPDRIEIWVATLEGAFEADLAAGTPSNDAVARVEALIAVMGQMTPDEIAEAMTAADAITST